MSPALQAYFSEYATFHATPGNKACHMFAIPLIVLATFAMLAHVSLVQVGGVSVTAAEVLLFAATLYYLSLDATLALLMLTASIALVALGRQLPLAAGVALFAFGWVVQFIGHYVYEKKSPAFFKNLTHLLVGPLWVLAKATGRA